MRKWKNYLGLAALGMVLCASMTGCGNNTNGSTSGNNTQNVAEDVVDDAGDAVEDVADGVGDAVDDLVGNGGFDNYNDAHDYFLDTMGSYHSDSKFELRDEDRELNDYQEGSKGYHFKLYDTSKDKDGEMFGEFFVDANSGKIYQKDDKGTIHEYPENNDNGNHNSGNTNNAAGSDPDNTSNGTDSNNNNTGNNGVSNNMAQ